jgi:hypothetical protein
MKNPFEIGAWLGAWLGCGVFGIWAWPQQAIWNDGMSFFLAVPFMVVFGVVGGALGWIVGRFRRR